MANGGMYGEGEEEKKYSWLEKKIAIKAKKRACTSDFRSPFHSYKQYRKRTGKG